MRWVGCRHKCRHSPTSVSVWEPTKVFLCPMQDASEYFVLFVTSYKVRDFMSKLLFLASPN